MDGLLCWTSVVFAAVFLCLSSRMIVVSAIVDEIRTNLYVAVPATLRMMFFTLADVAFLALVGRWDGTPVTHFDGVSLGTMFVNVTGLSLALGFSNSLMPFVSQNSGSGADHRNGLYFSKYVRASAVIFLGALAMAEFAEALMISLHQVPEVARCVQQFTRIAVWSLPGNFFAKGIQAVLEARRDVLPGLASDVFLALLQVGLCYALLDAGYGFQGAAFARVIASSVAAALLACFVSLTGRSAHVWAVPKGEASVPMRLYLKQALPQTFATCAEWWAQETMALIAGTLPFAQTMVGAHAILFNSAAVVFMAGLGLRNALSTRVGNLVGAGQQSRVPHAIGVGVALAAVEVLLLVLGAQAMRGPAIRLFTADAQVFAAVNDAYGVMLAVFPPYFFTFALFGVLAGCGRQSEVLVVFMISMAIGLPTGAYLGVVRGFGLSGIWVGNVLSFAISAMMLLVAVLRTDWRSVRSLDSAIASSTPLLESPSTSKAVHTILPIAVDSAIAAA